MAFDLNWKELRERRMQTVCAISTAAQGSLHDANYCEEDPDFTKAGGQCKTNSTESEHQLIFLDALSCKQYKDKYDLLFYNLIFIIKFI